MKNSVRMSLPQTVSLKFEATLFDIIEICPGQSQTLLSTYAISPPQKAKIMIYLNALRMDERFEETPTINGRTLPPKIP